MTTNAELNALIRNKLRSIIGSADDRWRRTHRAPTTIPTASFDNAVRLSSEASSADDPYFRCYGTEEVIFPEDHFVPHWLPGTNPSVGDKAGKMFVPVEATLGNAETMYPEYIDVIRKWRTQHQAEKDKKMPTAGVPTQGRRPGDQ